MRTFSIPVIAFLLQISLSITMSIAAEKSQGQTVGPKNETVAPKYLDIAFDRKINKIPVPFLGHDIKQVYEAFDERTRSERKDEFETTKRYQKKRLTNRPQKPLFGSVGKKSVLAFVVSPKLEYDADNQELIIRVITTHFRSAPSQLVADIKTVSWKNERRSQNAAGEIEETEEVYYESFELAIHNASRFNIGKPSDDNERAFLVQRIKMSIEDARRSKHKISALILAKPIAPFNSYEARSIPATFDDESEYYYEHLYVHVNLIELWIYNKLTGEIMAKIKPM